MVLLAVAGTACSLLWVSGAAGWIRFPSGAIGVQLIYPAQCLLMAAEIAKVKSEPNR